MHADGDYHRAGLCSLVLSTLGFCKLALHSKISKPKIANKECVYISYVVACNVCGWMQHNQINCDLTSAFAVHVWLFVESTQELLVQKRADRKDSWPGLWDISSAGHITAGDTSLLTARQLQRTRLICYISLFVV